jgi:DNA-binding NarL/FixJ family response regulator
MARAQADVLRRLAQLSLGSRTVVLSARALPGETSEVLRAGAVGHLTKDVAPKEILRAVRAAAGRPSASGQAARAVPADHRLRLTAREPEVWRLVAEGRSNAEIAAALRVGLSTVKAHVARVLAMLGVEHRTQEGSAKVGCGVFIWTERGLAACAEGCLVRGGWTVTSASDPPRDRG